MKKKLLTITGLTSLFLVLCFAVISSSAFESSGNFFDDHDADGDGIVSQEEFTGPDGHFDNLDANGDGDITSDEGPTGPPEGGLEGNGPRGEGPGNGNGPQGGGPGKRG